MILVCVCVGGGSTIQTSLCVSPQQHEPSLLPEVTAQDQGKICVVIDLDETLVHSSFKVPKHIFLDVSASICLVLVCLVLLFDHFVSVWVKASSDWLEIASSKWGHICITAACSSGASILLWLFRLLIRIRVSSLNHSVCLRYIKWIIFCLWRPRAVIYGSGVDSASKCSVFTCYVMPCECTQRGSCERACQPSPFCVLPPAY